MMKTLATLTTAAKKKMPTAMNRSILSWDAAKYHKPPIATENSGGIL